MVLQGLKRFKISPQLLSTLADLEKDIRDNEANAPEKIYKRSNLAICAAFSEYNDGFVNGTMYCP